MGISVISRVSTFFPATMLLITKSASLADSLIRFKTTDNRLLRGTAVFRLSRRAANARFSCFFAGINPLYCSTSSNKFHREISRPYADARYRLTGTTNHTNTNSMAASNTAIRALYVCCIRILFQRYLKPYQLRLGLPCLILDMLSIGKFHTLKLTCFLKVPDTISHNRLTIGKSGNCGLPSLGRLFPACYTNKPG